MQITQLSSEDDSFGNFIKFLKANGQDPFELGVVGPESNMINVSEEEFRKSDNGEKADDSVRFEPLSWDTLKRRTVKISKRVYENTYKSRVDHGGREFNKYRDELRTAGKWGSF